MRGAENAPIGAASAERLTLDAQIADPATRPVMTTTVAADGIQQGAITGNARLTANGFLDALTLRLSSDLRTPQGPVTLSAARFA